MDKVLINADGQTLGRLASLAAKRALNGENVIIINAEKAVVSGKREHVLAQYKKEYGAMSLVNPARYGPKRPKKADRFVRRAIRGMLPWKTKRGKDAFRRVMTYSGEPKEEVEKRHKVDITKAEPVKMEKKYYDDFVTVKDICEFLGGA